MKGEEQILQLEKESLAFTYCQIPVVYHRSDRKEIRIHLSDGTAVKVSGLNLGPEHSKQVFERSGAIDRIEVWLAPGL